MPGTKPRKLALAGVVVRHAELGVAIPEPLRMRAIDWLEKEEIDWDEETKRRLRREKEIALLRQGKSSAACRAPRQADLNIIGPGREHVPWRHGAPWHFENLIEVMPEVDRLLAGYDAGRPLVAGPGVPSSVHRRSGSRSKAGRHAPLAGPANGRPDHRQADPRHGTDAGRDQARPETGNDPRAGAGRPGRSRGAAGRIHYYQSYADPFPEHPFFGPLSRHDWDRLHRIHCAHHLSFL